MPYFSRETVIPTRQSDGLSDCRQGRGRDLADLSAKNPISDFMNVEYNAHMQQYYSENWGEYYNISELE